MNHAVIAAHFLRQNPNLEYSWIWNEKNSGPHPAGRLYWTSFPRDLWAPSSALIKLVQAIFDRQLDQSFFLLRQKIHTTAPLTELDLAVVKLAAKRAQGGWREQAFHGDETRLGSEIIPENVASDEPLFRSRLEQLTIPASDRRLDDEDQARARLAELSNLIPRGEVLHDFNRPVAAILRGPHGEILAESVHGGYLNKTLHAETRLVQEFYRRHGRGFPEGSTLYVSLKPCRMCAAMLSKMSEGLRDFQVCYVDDDPGPRARNTSLEKAGRLFSL